MLEKKWWKMSRKSSDFHAVKDVEHNSSCKQKVRYFDLLSVSEKM